MFNVGPMELAVILLVALLVVGPKRLPELGKTIGKSLRELRKVQDELRATIDFDTDTPPSFDRPPSRPKPNPGPRRYAEEDEDDEESVEAEEGDDVSEPSPSDSPAIANPDSAVDGIAHDRDAVHPSDVDGDTPA